MKRQSLKYHWKFSVAPMMKWTTPECRKIHRILNPNAMLYTEMVTTGAIIHGDKGRHLAHQNDDPCALQLGGGNPSELAKSVGIANNYNYSEINLNVGCPSDRVQNNLIGACLMANPKLVAECLNAMQAETDTPVTIKHRLAIDEQHEESVLDFVDYIYHHTNCRFFIIHARKALLQGLSPKKNRQIPKLNYDLVYRIKALFPDCIISINGGISDIQSIQAQLNHVDGVMLGRAAYQNPQIIIDANQIFGKEIPTKKDVFLSITQLLLTAQQNEEKLWEYYRHMLGFFQGLPGAKNYRRVLSEKGSAAGASVAVWEDALSEIKNI